MDGAEGAYELLGRLPDVAADLVVAVGGVLRLAPAERQPGTGVGDRVVHGDQTQAVQARTGDPGVVAADADGDQVGGGAEPVELRRVGAAQRETRLRLVEVVGRGRAARGVAELPDAEGLGEDLGVVAVRLGAVDGCVGGVGHPVAVEDDDVGGPGVAECDVLHPGRRQAALGGGRSGSGGREQGGGEGQRQRDRGGQRCDSARAVAGAEVGHVVTNATPRLEVTRGRGKASPSSSGPPRPGCRRPCTPAGRWRRWRSRCAPAPC